MSEYRKLIEEAREILSVVRIVTSDSENNAPDLEEIHRKLDQALSLLPEWQEFDELLATLREINNGRCYVQINNDADGVWHGTVGVTEPVDGKNMADVLSGMRKRYQEICAETEKELAELKSNSHALSHD